MRHLPFKQAFIQGRCFALLLAGMLPACRQATQIDLLLTTDAQCVDVDETRIAVGTLGEIAATAPAATTTNCGERSGMNARIGNLVIIPGGEKERTVGIEVLVGVGQPTEECLPPLYKGGCIVARRALAFTPHKSLELPIALEISCLDIPCEATQTCSSGRCVSAFLEDPLNCTEPGGCNGEAPGAGGGGNEGEGVGGGVDGAGGSDQPSSGGAASGGAASGGAASGGAASGGAASGGAASGGAASGGAASGGAASGGTGGMALPECGDGNVDADEACDDDNLTSKDGCSSYCREEFFLAVNETNSKIVFLNRTTGDYVRDFAGAPNANPFSPLYVFQVASGNVLVSDSSNGNVHQYDIHGVYVDSPLTGKVGVSGIASMGGDLLAAASPLYVKAYDSSTYAFIENVVLGDDAYAVKALDDRWLLSVGPSYGELNLFDRQNIGSWSILYDGGGAFHLHVTRDLRVLLPDLGRGEVVELVQNPTPTPPSPLGLPLVTGRTVMAANPFSVVELPGGDWLVGGVSGLRVYDPDLDTELSEKSTDTYRVIEEYTGPLPGE